MDDAHVSKIFTTLNLPTPPKVESPRQAPWEELRSVFPIYLALAKHLQIEIPFAQNKRVLPRVLAIAGDVFQVPESSVEPSSSPDTIESWDSLHHLSFVVALEQEFGVQFSPEEIEQLLSIELTAVLIEEKTKEGGSSNGC